MCLRSDKNPNFPLFLSPPLNFLSLYAIPLSTARASPMASAGDGATPYQSGGAGGKFRKKPIRRSAQGTPYDRPPTALRNNNPSLMAKLVDPASRLIYAGADRLFGVFRKRLPSIAAPRPPETREEPELSTDKAENVASISATTEISELESMLKHKTFTRSEIEHLTALLQAKTANSDDDEGDRAKITSPSSHFLRLEASTSKHHVEEREKENIHAAISTPVVTSRAFEEDVASPAELARAYMGTLTPKVSPTTLRFGTQAPRQDSALLNTTTILPKTPRTTATFKSYENGFTTPRSRGRSAIYSMARTPYSRPPSAFSQKGMNSPSLPFSLEQERSIDPNRITSIYKRRSSVLDDIGSGGPVRRIRQKANLSSQGSPLSKNTNEYSQKPGFKTLKGVEENGETSRSTLGHASVPSKSTQTATKILEQLERFSPKEKSPVSRLALTNEKVDSPCLKIMSSSQDNKKTETLVVDARERTSTSSSQSSKGKEKVEENGPRKFAVPRNLLNGNAGVTLRDSNGNTDSMFKPPPEPAQKKRFQMSGHEDNLEGDDDSRSNGHVSIPFGQNKKAETSVFSKSEVHKSSVPQVEKVPETQKVDEVKSVQKKVTFNMAPSNNTQPAVTETVASQKKPTVFPSFGVSATTETVSPFPFAANQSSVFKTNTSPDSKPLPSTSFFKENKEKEENGIAAKSDSGVFSFGGKSSSNGTTFASSSPPFPSFTSPIFGAQPPETTARRNQNIPAAASSFATATTGGSSNIFGFSSPAPTSTTSGFQTSFGGTTSLFGSSAPTFGLGSASETKSNSTPSFGNWQAPTSSAAFTFGASASASATSTSPTNVFNSSSSSSMFSSPSPSPSQPIFGSTPTPTPASPINNDQMSMEDTMAEDTSPTPTPSFPSFGQPSSSGASIFGSTTPPPSTVPFMFGGQANQPPPQPLNPFQNPFQASGTGSAGGSFSLGSGGGDKSGRRIVKVRKNRNK
ncbi:hypothetical protein LXL04_012789 [Taraxacum kok-saghyz]